MSGSSSETDLLSAVRDSLHRDGRLGRFKAELRAAVMSILSKRSVHEQPPEIPKETKLINDLLREYLIWNGYIYTDQVLLSESGQNKEKPSREDLAAQIGIPESQITTKIPLLYYVVAAFQDSEYEDD